MLAVFPIRRSTPYARIRRAARCRIVGGGGFLCSPLKQGHGVQICLTAAVHAAGAGASALSWGGWQLLLIIVVLREVHCLLHLHSQAPISNFTAQFLFHCHMLVTAATTCICNSCLASCSHNPGHTAWSPVLSSKILWMLAGTGHIAVGT